MGEAVSGQREDFVRAAWRGVRRWAIRRREEAGDRTLGIETMGPRQSPAAIRELRNKPYEPLPYEGLRRTTALLDLQPDDVVYDLGCGKGRIVCWFAREPIAKSAGVEYDAELAEVARANAASLKGARAQIEILTADAAAVDYSDATVIYLYNSFGPEVLRPVLQNLSDSLAARPRRLRLAYASPTHVEEFKAFPKFVEVNRISMPYDLGEMAVAFFEAGA
jgi:precorrin-6B methylase 2